MGLHSAPKVLRLAGTTATGVVSSGPAIIDNVIINEALVGTLKIYDNASAASGTTVLEAAATTTVQSLGPLGVCENGITVALSVNDKVTIVYRTLP